MNLPSKLLEQLASDTRHKIEEHGLIVMDKSTHEENSFQPLQTNKIQFKTAATFLTRYKGISNVTDQNNKFNFISVFEGAEYKVITIPPGAYELESLKKD